MGLNHPNVGINYSAEFTISAIPWITSSTIPTESTEEFNFNHVTKWITVKNNTSGSLAAVGVTLNGVEKSWNYFTIAGGDSTTFDWRVVRLFVSSSEGIPNVSIAAGLTGIQSKHSDALYNLTGSSGLSGIG